MRSQISHMLADSAWEQHVANLLETSPLVEAYAKNDHLGFQVYYMWNGAKRRYIPDFLIRLTMVRAAVRRRRRFQSSGRDAYQAWVGSSNSKPTAAQSGHDIRVTFRRYRSIERPRSAPYQRRPCPALRRWPRSIPLLRARWQCRDRRESRTGRHRRCARDQPRCRNRCARNDDDRPLDTVVIARRA